MTDKKNSLPLSLPLLDDFLLNLKTSNYSDKTLYNYERDLEVFSIFLNEIGLALDNASKNTLLNYKAYLISIDRQTPNKNQSHHRLTSYSINRMLSTLRSYLRYLIDMDYQVPVSPESVKLMKTERKHPQIAELNELIRLIESPTKLEKNKIVSLRNRAMLEILFSTGMRISELINLKRAQIDRTGRIFIMGKGKKERFVYLTPRARTYLEKYLFTRGNDQLPYLFVPYRGKNIASKNRKISANYLQEKIKRYRELLGINIPISAHSLRHGFATYLAENGANPAAIQILLGHESLETTTRYVHASDRYAEKTHRQYHPLTR